MWNSEAGAGQRKEGNSEKANLRYSNGEAKMTSFLRGKQAGVQRDFSSGLDPQLFAIDQVRCYMTSKNLVVPQPDDLKINR